jgi:hypothetical protein
MPANLDTSLSPNARLMLNIMTDIVFADEEEGEVSFEVVGPILQKNLQVSDEEVKALTELFKANIREQAMNHPSYDPNEFPKSLLPGPNEE